MCLLPALGLSGDARGGAQVYVMGVCQVFYYLDADKVRERGRPACKVVLDRRRLRTQQREEGAWGGGERGAC